MPDIRIIGDEGLIETTIRPRRETYHLVTEDSLRSIRGASILADVFILLASLSWGPFFTVLIAQMVSVDIPETTTQALKIIQIVSLVGGFVFLAVAIYFLYSVHSGIGGIKKSTFPEPESGAIKSESEAIKPGAGAVKSGAIKEIKAGAKSPEKEKGQNELIIRNNIDTTKLSYAMGLIFKRFGLQTTQLLKPTIDNLEVETHSHGRRGYFYFLINNSIDVYEFEYFDNQNRDRYIKVWVDNNKPEFKAELQMTAEENSSAMDILRKVLEKK